MSETGLHKRPLLIPAAIAALMLFGALGDWPYGYYLTLRLVVCGISAYTAFVAYEWQQTWAAWLFAGIALLFNPFVPVHLPKELWQVIDVACGVLFIAIMAILRERRHTRTKRELNTTRKAVRIPGTPYNGTKLSIFVTL